MVYKISNYLVFAALFLSLSAGSVFADPLGNDAESTLVKNKRFSFYNKFVISGEPQSYLLKVEEGKETIVTIHSKNGVSLKIQTPDGEIGQYSDEKYFNLKFHRAGEYVIELDSLAGSHYSLEILTR